MRKSLNCTSLSKICQSEFTEIGKLNSQTSSKKPLNLSIVNMENMYFILFVWSPIPRPQVLGPRTKATDQNQGHLQSWLSPICNLAKSPPDPYRPAFWPRIRQKHPPRILTLQCPNQPSRMSFLCLEAIKIGQEKCLLCLVCQEVGLLHLQRLHYLCSLLLI